MQGIIMHLSYSTSKYKSQVYKSYSIAESYRDGKISRKRTIWSIGKLTDQQAEQIRLILQVIQSEDQVVTRLKDIVVQESRAYLDIAVVNALWEQWQLDKAFDYDVTDSTLPTHTMAKILTINRCTDPCSHYAIPMWAKKTALKEQGKKMAMVVSSDGLEELLSPLGFALATALEGIEARQEYLTFMEVIAQADIHFFLTPKKDF